MPKHLLGNLMQAFDKASSSFSNILTTLKPDLLICDFFQPWALALALSLNIPTLQFVISGNEANSVAVHALKNSAQCWSGVRKRLKALASNQEGEKTEITEWLNKKDTSSVIFVSFGTENYLSKEERGELALGLLLSKVNFIWVLRPEYRVREDLAIFSFFKFVKKQARGFVKVNATKAITIPQNQTCSFSFSDNQQN
uniref:Anthocyanidin 3-O-glucosyltransferase n=1 Tax=Populus trichocarpa TaxID=3694 RepID=A0A2K1YZ70_POPTR